MILWITGASSGIGRETAKAFLQRGDTVYATARNTDSLNSLASEVQGLPGKLYPVSCDMRDKGAVAAFVQEHFSEQMPDGFINAAGITSFTFIADDTLDVIENIIQTNLLGAIYGIKSVLPLMKEKGGGVIVNILSVVTEKVLTKSGAYSASKAGLL
ncbi:partial putative oxidoreductase EphD, partial [Methylococcales bacterium]